MNEGANERNNEGIMGKKGEIDIGWMRWRKGWKKKKKRIKFLKKEGINKWRKNKGKKLCMKVWITLLIMLIFYYSTAILKEIFAWSCWSLVAAQLFWSRSTNSDTRVTNPEKNIGWFWVV